MPRPTMEAATPTPALPPALRELEGACVGVAGGREMNSVKVGELVEVEDVDANAEDDVVELDAACLVKDCGGGA